MLPKPHRPLLLRIRKEVFQHTRNLDDQLTTLIGLNPRKALAYKRCVHFALVLSRSQHALVDEGEELGRFLADFFVVDGGVLEHLPHNFYAFEQVGRHIALEVEEVVPLQGLLQLLWGVLLGLLFLLVVDVRL